MAKAEIKVPDSVMRAIVREQIAQLLPDIRREARRELIESGTSVSASEAREHFAGLVSDFAEASRIAYAEDTERSEAHERECRLRVTDAYDRLLAQVEHIAFERGEWRREAEFLRLQPAEPGRERATAARPEAAGMALVRRNPDGTFTVERADPVIGVSRELWRQMEPDGGRIQLDAAGEYLYTFSHVLESPVSSAHDVIVCNRVHRGACYWRGTADCSGCECWCHSDSAAGAAAVADAKDKENRS